MCTAHSSTMGGNRACCLLYLVANTTYCTSFTKLPTIPLTLLLRISILNVIVEFAGLSTHHICLSIPLLMTIVADLWLLHIWNLSCTILSNQQPPWKRPGNASNHDISQPCFPFPSRLLFSGVFYHSVVQNMCNPHFVHKTPIQNSVSGCSDTVDDHSTPVLSLLAPTMRID